MSEQPASDAAPDLGARMEQAWANIRHLAEHATSPTIRREAARLLREGVQAPEPEPDRLAEMHARLDRVERRLNRGR